VQSLKNLSGINILSALETTALNEIEKLCFFKNCASNEQIIDRHSETTDIFFVISGVVRVANYSLSGRIISFADLSAGSHFGELAALDGQLRSASVFSLTNCLLATISKGQFLALLKKYPSVALMVMKSLAKIIRTSTNRIMDLSTLAANNRVQADLLRMAKKFEIDGVTAEISPIPIHGDIASRVSTSRETVARVLMDLAKRGIVQRQKKSLVVKDIKQLSDMVKKMKGE
jgi:CRP-like cAMP-binding protein